MMGKLTDIKKITVYYGHDQEEKLKGFDLLIVEPKGHSREGIFSLRQSGSTVLAYISMIEIERDDALLKTMSPDDFISINKEISVNSAYNNLLLDISKPKIQKLFLARAISLLQDGYDGIFIDTLDSLEYLNIEGGSLDKMLKAAAMVLLEIKRAFPDAVIIQNNGFNKVCYYTYPYLDGICFENPPCVTLSNLLWSFGAFERLDKLSREHSIRVMVLQEIYDRLTVKQHLIKRTAKMKGYFYYETKRFYNTI